MQLLVTQLTLALRHASGLELCGLSARFELHPGCNLADAPKGCCSVSCQTHHGVALLAGKAVLSAYCTGYVRYVHCHSYTARDRSALILRIVATAR